MKTRDDFEFVLAPWEHRGAVFDARPDLVVESEIEGQTRVFLLKIKRNALWFREAERGENWTFGVLSPLEADSGKAEFWRSEPEFLAQWFKNELKSGNFGRVVVWDDFSNRMGNFIFLFCADGRGVAREPWDEEGLSFEWSAFKEMNESESLDWPFETFKQAAQKLDDNRALNRKFNDRDVPQPVLDGEDLHWLCGSQENLRQLATWTAHLNDNFWDEGAFVRFVFGAENDYGHAALRAIWRMSSTGLWGNILEISASIQRLSEIFLDFNTPAGCEWEFQDAQGGRDSWDPEGPNVIFDIESPTAHEKLEAHQNLREWLRGKVPEAEIEALLQT